LSATDHRIKIVTYSQLNLREFTTVYHDEIKAVQAFPQFEETNKDGTPNPLAFTLHSVRDAFAINYGTGGIGAEIHDVSRKGAKVQSATAFLQLFFASFAPLREKLYFFSCVLSLLLFTVAFSQQ
jgi:hypothetical protein